MKLISLSLAALLAASLPGAVLAQAAAIPAGPVRPAYGPALNLEDAMKVAAAAAAESRKHGWSMAIAVAEPTGDIVLMYKMDGTQYSSPDLAMTKARSSARFRRPTKEFEDALVGGRQAILGLPGAIPIEGGIPLLRDGKLVGALGISGGTAAQDHLVAEAALAAFR